MESKLMPELIEKARQAECTKPDELLNEELDNVSGGVDSVARISDVLKDPPKGRYCHYCGSKLTKIGLVNANYRCLNCGAEY